MKNMRIVFVGVVFAVSFAHAATEVAPPKNPETTLYTIKSAVQEALEHDPTVRSAREKLNEVNATYRMAFSSLLPSLNNTSTAYLRKDAVNMGSAAFGGDAYNYYQVLFSISQPLYDGSLFAAVRAGDKQKEISQLDVEIAERNLTSQVLQSFYSLLLNQRKLAMLKRTQDVQNKILKTAKERYRIGRSKILDVLQIKTQIALVDPKISQAQSQIEISSADLANLLGNRTMRKLSIEGTLDYPTLPQLAKTLPERLKKSTLRLAELERVYKQVDQIADINAVTFAKHYPKLSLNGTWGRSSYTRSELLEDFSTAWNVNLQLTIPIFSGLSSVYERRQLASREAQMQIEQTRQYDQASLSQIRAEKNFALAADVIVSSAQASQYAHESLMEAEKEYRLSISDLIQYLNAETSYLSAESSFDQAKYDFIQAASQFHVASGVPLQGFVEWLDSQGKK